MTLPKTVLDVLIIGGGPAGLSVASGLNRLLHPCIVFDSGVYRNSRSTHMHNFPTWDHRHPADFRAAVRRDLTDRYDTTRIVEARVDRITKLDDGTFEAIDSRGQAYLGKKLVLATGVRDIYPDIPGYDECWGYGIFHCLYCHGYEERGVKSSAVLAVDAMANAKHPIVVGGMARRLADKTTILTDGNKALADDLRAAMAPTARRLHLDDRKILRFAKVPGDNADVDVYFEDGSRETFGFIAHAPRTEVNGPWVEQLGLELMDGGSDIKVNAPFNETSLAGVFAAGDCATPFKAVATGVSMALFAANGAAMQVQQGQ